MSTAPPALVDELKEVALSVGIGASEILRTFASAALAQVSTKSSPTDLVSEADRASEAYIESALRKARPGDSLLAEEGSAHDGGSGVRWVADPLDGTTNFVFRLPAYSVSLAAQWQRETVVGVVVDPSRQETWMAVQGQGAWCNDEPCHVASDRSSVATALLATGFSYQPDRRAVQGAVLAMVLPVVRDIRRFGSAALDLCWLAAGRYDGYYESWLNEWDWAAGRLICQEAGASTTLVNGRTLVASEPDIHAELVKLIEAAERRADGDLRWPQLRQT